MPVEARSRPIANKPLTPALSSNLRQRPANGLTPRLAAASTTSPISQAQPQASLRQQTLSPDRNIEDRTISLNSNITPRSGIRSSRVDTESPATPETAGRSRRAIGTSEESSLVNHGLGICSPVPTPTRAKSSDQVSFLPTANGRRISGGSVASAKNGDSKFFRVDDLKRTYASSPKSAKTARLLSPRISPSKASNDESYDADTTTRTIVKSPTSTLSYRAIDTSTVPFSPGTDYVGSPLSSDSQNACAQPEVSKTRAILKQVPLAAQNAQMKSSPNIQSALVSPLDRRRSSSLNFKPITSTSSQAHRKSLSTSSSSIGIHSKGTPPESPQNLKFDVMSARKDFSVSNNAMPSPAESITPTTLESTLLTNESAQSPLLNRVTDVSQQRPGPRPRHYRGSSEATAIQPVTKEHLEAAANARRERKVLDLEISNSSLLAINKTLEKELRKQNLELRRFRRLSRSGRLSLTVSNRIVSAASTSSLMTLGESDHEGGYTNTHRDDSDRDSIGYEDDNLSDEDSSVTGSSELARRRARDERKLMLDLQRHQQILLDSQRLTQSIQRCLNTTEELLREGDTALAYRVEEKDVQLGGKVLNQDDDEALSEVDFDSYQESIVGPRQALLSPSITKSNMEEASVYLNSLQAVDGQYDTNHYFRDSPSTKSPSPTLELSPMSLPDG